MCCFSGPVSSVSDTSIFVRDAEKGRQHLVYSMHYQAGEDLAMVLPLPVPKGTAEEAVKFIDLSRYPDFFADLKSGFPAPAPASKSLMDSLNTRMSAPALKVVRVGSFVASFVPKVSDFERLDPRFRLPSELWNQVPAYKRFGFAVFKLRKDAHSVHPMALSFPREDPAKLFFPTVHVHDGQVHKTARFDHDLYCQVGTHYGRPASFVESPQPASSFMHVNATHGIIDGHAHCYFERLTGEHPNQDILI